MFCLDWRTQDTTEVFTVVKMEAATSSETLVSYCNTTWNNDQKDLDLKKAPHLTFIKLGQDKAHKTLCIEVP
jgi:hypothetical protein